jgi:Ni2+-binding GTPase involved in maturation of urease and hydrogenase/DNA-binding transcriptional ArsR family regulator
MADNRDSTECLPFLRALSDESRWEIARLLVAAPDGVTLGDLAGRLGLSNYNASRHVRVLHESGIVAVTREGRFKRIGIAPEFRSRIRAQSGSDALDLGCCRFDFSQQTPAPGSRLDKQLRDSATVPNVGPMSSPARYIMIGGFLGAGKTTAVAAVAKHLADAGKRVGLITNDQGRELVDTRMLRSRGFATEEIAGGCFCCKFNSLVDAATRLDADAAPEVFIAEPVGSCTDLVATVTYPLRRIYGDRFTVAPLSVLVDPMRARRILGLEEGRGFSDKVLYIYRKQLEEADVIIISKRDLLDEAGEAELRAALEREFPKARVIAVSARKGEGLEPWFEILESETQTIGVPMEVDYDTYAEGEALLGWLNATIDLEVDDEIDSAALLQSLAREIQARLLAAGAEVAHLKMTLSPANAFAGEVAVINLVRNDFSPEMGQELDEPIEGGQIILNLRAEGDPEQLEAIVRESIAAVQSADCRLALDHLERFRPGRPVPTHRDA